MANRNKAKHAYAIGLNPCPFCGERSELRNQMVVYDSEGRAIVEGNRLDGLPNEYIVICGKCGARTINAPDKESAYAYWQAELFNNLTYLLAEPGYTDDPEPWNKLRDAIVKNAFYDYKAAVVKKLQYGGRGKIPDSEWFKTEGYERLCSIPGEAIIEAAKKQAVYDVWRRRHGCAHCNRRKTPCIHRKEYPWMKFTRGMTPPCPKDPDGPATYKEMVQLLEDQRKSAR